MGGDVHSQPGGGCSFRITACRQASDESFFGGDLQRGITCELLESWTVALGNSLQICGLTPSGTFFNLGETLLTNGLQAYPVTAITRAAKRPD